MKIGVLFSAYNCASYIDQCLEPWLKLKKEFNLILAATNGRYILSPYEAEDMKGSHSLLKLLGKDLDFLLHSCGENRWTEEQGRNYMLKYVLDQEVDLVWVIDCDEIYTEGDIRSILSYIKGNPKYDCYNLYYKNYFIKYPYWIMGFNKASIYWADRKTGIKGFYFDCDIEYNDGTKVSDINRANIDIIPKNIAHIDHYSWMQGDARVKDKIFNQEIKYNGKKGCRCSFKYDEKNNLTFNELFYEDRNMQLPLIHKTLIDDFYICDIEYDRVSNVIYFKNIVDKDFYTISVFDCCDNLLYYCSADLKQDYFIGTTKNLSDDPYFVIEFKKEDKVVRKDELHVNFKDY